VAASACEASERIEIVAERRRAHGDAFRAMVVLDALRPGARVQEVARRHRICPSLVYRWRRLAQPGQTIAPSAGCSGQYYADAVGPDLPCLRGAIVRSWVNVRSAPPGSRSWRGYNPLRQHPADPALCGPGRGSTAAIHGPV
jgi:transposase-like protein